MSAGHMSAVRLVAVTLRARGARDRRERAPRARKIFFLMYFFGVFLLALNG